MKEFQDIFPKTDFAMDALITAIIEETENMDQEDRYTLFLTAISRVALLAGTAINENYGHGTFTMDDAETGHNLLEIAEKRFMPTAMRVAKEEMEDRE